MATVSISPILNGQQFFDNNGNMLSGGKIFTYQAGTSTPVNSYTTSAGSTANSNPIVLNSSGRSLNEIWLDISYMYKLVVTLSDGTTVIGTYDNINPNNLGSLANLVVTTSAIVPVATLSTQAAQASQLIGHNVVVNGGCETSQVNGTTLFTPANNSYPIDNWNFQASQASKLQTQQVSTLLGSLGATTSLTTSVLAQYTTNLATDFFYHQIPIEGINFARFQYGTANAKTGSLQFKARASVSGTYAGSIQNYVGNRSLVFTFTLTANTDTLINVFNIPGDTGGTWVGATNAGAAYVLFDLGSGSNFQTTSGTWQTGDYVRTSGAVQLVANVNGSGLTVTDVQFEVGRFCTQFERKLYNQVLIECQRLYYQPPAGAAYAVSIGIGGYASMTVPLPTVMRVAPTVVINLADSQYAGANPTTSTQWSFVLPGVGYPTKTGTCTFNAMTGTNGMVGITFNVATFGTGTQLITNTPVILFTANAQI